MNTVTVWLLISLSSGAYNQRPVTLVERFATVEECQRVKELVKVSGYGVDITRCIQATVVKP